MGPSTQKLIEIASSSFIREGMPFHLNLESYGKNGQDICQILSQKNGFFCFEQALHFYSSENSENSMGILEWNDQSIWKCDYKGLADNVFCFAEDIFSNQFCIVDEEIGVFNPETGDIKIIAQSVEEWSAKILLEYNLLTGYKIAHDWQKINGYLKSWYRLMPKKPFVLGGVYDLRNLVALDSIKIMKTLGNLAHQIHNLPDGAQIQFKII